MMRRVIVFFLFMFFLMVRGNYHLYAYTHQHPIGHTPAKLSQKTEQPGSGSVKNKQTQICQSSTTSNTENGTIDATDEIEDDDDVTPSRKNVEISNYFLTLFYNLLPDNLTQYQKDRLPFCKHFSYTSSSKYLIHRVIRV